MSDQLFPAEQLLRNRRGRIYAKVLADGTMLYACANKHCSAEFKPKSAFNPRGDGTHRLQPQCKACRARTREERITTDAAYHESFKKQQRDYKSRSRKTPEGRARILVRSARNRAQSSGGKFTCTLTEEWCNERLAAGKCEATGAPLVFDWERKIVDGRAWTHPFAPSIDRKDPKGDYSPENCQITCWIYNRCKADCTHGDIVVMARFLLKHDGPIIAALN